MAFCSTEISANSLTEEFLQALRAARETPDDDIDLVTQAGRQQLVTTDQIMAAQMLASTLAPHFRSLEDLAKSALFIAMPVRDATEGDLFAAVLKATLPDGIVTIGPRYESDRRRFIIFVPDFPLSHERMTVVKAAAKQGNPILCLYDQGVDAPEAFVDIADLNLERPVITTGIVSKMFQEIFGTLPTNLSSITNPDALSAEDFALRLRPGRSPEACVDSLVASLPKEPEAPKHQLTLRDSHGYGDAKQWGLELAQDFNEWQLGKLAWHEVDHRAVLLTGIPGVGKTTFADLLAATLAVPLISSSVAEWNGHDHLSGTLKRMRAVFDKAMATTPCVLLIDEIDGISSRKNIEGRYAEYWTQIVNQMLELVTRAMSTEGLILVGATNFADRIDPALVRAGRLEQTIIIEPPDAEAITMILAHNIGTGFSKQGLRQIAERLGGQTGADIERLAEQLRPLLGGPATRSPSLTLPTRSKVRLIHCLCQSDGAWQCIGPGRLLWRKCWG